MTRPRLAAELVTIDRELFLCIYVEEQAGAFAAQHITAFLTALTGHGNITLDVRGNDVDVDSQVTLEGDTLSVASGEFDMVSTSIQLTVEERQFLASLIRRTVESQVTTIYRHQVHVTIRQREK